MRRALLGLVALALGAGCSDVTELLLVVQSNLDVPADIDAVRVEVTGSETMFATGNLSGPRAQPLPRTVGIVRSGGRLGPLHIRVVGTLRGIDVVERTASTSFVDGQTRVLEVVLSRACVGQACPTGQTCVDGACASEEIDSGDLREYEGTVPRFDGGSCAIERCDEEDNDCDGRVDEGFMLETNVASCGACGRICDPDNARPACVAGECTIASCDNGFDDCNGDPADGCEASVRSLTDCGACGVPCAAASGTPSCASGTCVVAACEDGVADCNMDVTDGCETATNTLTDCGGCGAPCDLPGASESCASGTCELVACEAGRGDCNLDPTDGCETSLATLTDCGACGAPCAVADGTPSCATGTCEVASCDMFFEDCNTDPSDGCEANTRMDEMTCGDCVTSCAAAEMCVNGMCR